MTSSVVAAVVSDSPVANFSTADAAPTVSLFAVHPQTVGPTGDVVQAGVMHRVEKMLEGTGNVPEVRRAAEDVAVGLQHLDRRHRQRRSAHDLQALNAGIGCTGHHCLEQLLAVWRWGVVDDE